MNDISSEIVCSINNNYFIRIIKFFLLFVKHAIMHLSVLTNFKRNVFFFILVDGTLKKLSSLVK